MGRSILLNPRPVGRRTGRAMWCDSLYCWPAPVLSRAVDVPWPIECGGPFDTNNKFGDAARTERLKTGADQLEEQQRPRRAEFFAPPVMGPPSRSPIRPFACTTRLTT